MDSEIIKDPLAGEGVEELEETAAGLEEFFTRLRKGLKTIGFYRHQTSAYLEYLRPAYEKLSEVLAGGPGVSLLVEQDRLKYKNTVVYQEPLSEQNLAFLLFRAGVRLLNLRPGLTPKELLGLVMCFLGEAEARQRGLDIVSLLWQQQFEHIEYVVIDSFALGKSDSEEVRQEVDQLVKYLVSRLSTTSHDVQKYARLSLDDFELQVDGATQAQGLVLKREPISEEEKTCLQQELANYERERQPRKLAELWLEVLRSGVPDEAADYLLGALLQAFDVLLLAEDLAGMDWLVDGLAALVRAPSGPQVGQLGEQALEEIKKRLAESATIDRLGDILEKRPGPEVAKRLMRYFQWLGESAFEGLLKLLERLTRPEARQVVSEAILSLAKGKEEQLAALLESAKPNLVRDVMQLLVRLNPAQLPQLLGRVFKHPNLALRLDALRAMAASGRPEAAIELKKALNDPDAQVRAAAASVLPQYDPQLARQALLEMLGKPDFADRPDREQAEIFGALVQVADAAASEQLRRILHASSLLGRKREENLKKNLISGLAASGTLAAYRFLKTELERGIKPAEMAEIARRACASLRQRLLKESADGAAR